MAPGPPPRSGGNRGLWLLVGTLTTLVLGGCGSCVLFAFWLQSDITPSAAALEALEYRAIPEPQMPPRGEPVELEDGQLVHKIQLRRNGFEAAPGAEGELWLYLPPGQHAPASLPCVLIAPSGATVMSGMPILEADEPEHVPYVREGFAVLCYSIDGPYYEPFDDDDNEELAKAYRIHKAAAAGLVNVRNALRYLARQAPEVDAIASRRGHSSAARWRRWRPRTNRRWQDASATTASTTSSSGPNQPSCACFPGRCKG